jgi:hypothetical protein
MNSCCPKCASSYGSKHTRLIGGIAWTRCPRCLEMFEAAATNELDEKDPTLVVQQFEESYSVPAKVVGPSPDAAALAAAKRSEPPVRFSSPSAVRPSRPPGTSVRPSRLSLAPLSPSLPAAPAIRKRASSVPPPLPSLVRRGYNPVARPEVAVEPVPESCIRKVVVVPREPAFALATIARQAPVIVGADEVAAASARKPTLSSARPPLTRWSRIRIGVLSFFWTLALGGTVSAPLLVTAQTARAAAAKRSVLMAPPPPAARAASALVNSSDRTDRSDVIELDEPF